MAFPATVYNVLIASPSDTMPSRHAIESALLSWDRDRSESSLAMMLPRRWETDAVPLVGGLDAQSVINTQLVDQADILFGVFYARLGLNTQRGISGTAEEIERAADAGKPVHVYFSTSPIPRDVDVEQLTALNRFKGDLATRGLLGEFCVGRRSEGPRFVPQWSMTSNSRSRSKFSGESVTSSATPHAHDLVAFVDDARSAGIHDLDQGPVDADAEARQIEAEAVWSAVAVDPGEVVQDTQAVPVPELSLIGLNRLERLDDFRRQCDTARNVGGVGRVLNLLGSKSSLSTTDSRRLECIGQGAR